ncbi:MAG: BatA domain-containing protein [Bacteroidales bacterium]
MHFLHPWYLLGLFALAIPIIIHFFHFHRYKKIYFTNVRFLEVLQTETRRTSRLRSLILLALRLLLITALVLAFAQPYLGNPTLLNAGSGRPVSIYLDNSLSMFDAQLPESRLARAKSKALEILSLFTSGDLFHVITNEKMGFQQRPVTQTQAQLWMNETLPSAREVSISEILNLQAATLQNSGKKGGIAFFVSDFSKSFFNPGPPPDTNLYWVFVPVESTAPGNVSIDSAWFEEPLIYPGLTANLRVKVTNHSARNPADVGLKLSLNNLQRGFQKLTVNPSASTTVSLPFLQSDTGYIEGQLEINDGWFPFDNCLYFSFRGQPPIHVLMIGGSEFNPYLQRLYATDSSIFVTRQMLRQVDFSLIGQSSLTLLYELTEYPSGLVMALKKTLEEGHSVAIIPPPTQGHEALQAFLAQLGIEAQIQLKDESVGVGEVNTQSILFKNVIEELPEYPELPTVKSYLQVKSGIQTPPEIQLKLKNDDPFLLAWQIGKGHLFLQTCSLREELTNFMHNNLFVPAYLNMAFAGQFQNPLYAVAGKPSLFLFENQENSSTDKAPELVNTDRDIRFIPPFRRSNGQLQILMGNQVPFDGFYQVLAQKQSLGKIAVNYSRNESNPEVYSPEEVRAMLENLGWKNFLVLDATDEVPIKAALEAGGGRRLPRHWLAWAALLFLTSEVILLRFWK